MLIRLDDPARQTSLLLFLRNSGIFSLEKVGDACIRVLDVDEAHLREVLAAWHGHDPENRAELEA